MPGERLYCPMCGEAFRAGDKRCARCEAPLPAHAPDPEAMERAGHARAEGAALAWSCLRRGFRLLRLRPALLVLPLLFSLGGLARFYPFVLSQGVHGAAGAARPVAPPASFAANVWLARQLDGRWAVELTARAGARMCAPVPVMPFATNVSFGVASTAVYVGALWADALLTALANALLWRGMWRALSMDGGASAATSTKAPPGAAAANARGPWCDARLLATVLALSALGPAQMALVGLRSWSPSYVELTVAFDVAALALATAGCAVVVAAGRRTPNGSPANLWARTLFSAEGIVYAATCIAVLATLSYVADFTLFVVVGLPPVGGASGWVGVLALVRACMTAWLATGTTLGFFCLLERHLAVPDGTAAAEVLDAEAAAQ